MTYKLDYITRLFQKTSNKAIEHYVLTRLWHRLDDDLIKIVPQQYVNRHKEKYALTDVYFPQVKIHVEVNEPAHYDSDERIEADEKRKAEIEKQTGHKVYVIDCRKKLFEIHDEIDIVINVIRSRIEQQKQNEDFVAWEPDVETDPQFWKSKNRLSVRDDVYLRNIESICDLFGADFNKTKRGFLRRGGLPHPRKNDVLLWWPSETTRQGWHNVLDPEGLTITETNQDVAKNQSHFNKYKDTDEIRCAFFHHKDVLGLTSYRFKGVFAYDREKSLPQTGIVWKRISDEVELF